jgi:bla regulator protein BlaR1
MTLLSTTAFPEPIMAALANHLWQSTLFAGTAWLLTLTLRENRPETRYGLWLIASVKFLVPFSLLVGLGSHLGWSKAPARTPAALFVAIDEMSQPFTLANPGHSAAPAALTWLQLDARVLPTLLLGVWFCGVATVLFFWYLRWRRIHAVLSRGEAVKSGREFEALRHHEGREGITRQIDLVVSSFALEPGILGVFRPVLLLPKGISNRLTDAELNAIVAHELCHVRRRDNLAATVHMFVEALFWFHPLAWWIGTRLVEERERACDEEVLRVGNDPQVYAEGILKVCEFYLESPLACVAGVTGSNLKKRIEAIMSHHVARNLSLAKKLFLSAMTALAVASPVVFGLLNATPGRAQSQSQNTGSIVPGFEDVTEPGIGVALSFKPERFASRTQPPAKNTDTVAAMYEVVSIKPHKSGDELFKMTFDKDGFRAIMVTLRMLIRTAYGVDDSRIFGAPNWLDSDKYDVEARMENSAAGRLSEMSEDQLNVERRRMLQALLADRFKLTLHRQTTQLGVYVLVVAKNGPKLQEAKPGDTYPNGLKDPEGGSPAGLFRLGNYHGGRGELVGQGLSMAKLLRLLSQNILNRSVIDNTELTGNYDFTLEWKIGDESQGPMFKETEDHPQVTGSTSLPEFSGPSFFNAIKEQLGLELESQNSPGVVLVIDHVEKPSEN